MEKESRLSDSSKSRSETNFSPHLNCLQRPVTEKFIELKIIANHPLCKIPQLDPALVHIPNQLQKLPSQQNPKT